MTPIQVSRDVLLQRAKSLADMWLNAYVKPLRGVSLEVKLVEGAISVTAPDYLNLNQDNLLDEYRKEVSEWFDYFVAQNH